MPLGTPQKYIPGVPGVGSYLISYASTFTRIKIFRRNRDLLGPMAWFSRFILKHTQKNLIVFVGRFTLESLIQHPVSASRFKSICNFFTVACHSQVVGWLQRLENSNLNTTSNTSDAEYIVVCRCASATLAPSLWSWWFTTGPASYRRCKLNFSIPTVLSPYNPWDREFWTPSIYL